MRVLDLGCGAGDVAFVAAGLVGPEGLVVGVDRSAQALERARERAQQARLSQVRFVEGDIHDPAEGGPFDAIVSRLTLMWVPDPVAILRNQATTLRPGGIVAPIEVDVIAAHSVPPIPMVSEAVGWLAEAFTRAGIHGALGPRLWTALVEAGLRPLGMTGVQKYFGPGDPVGAALLSGVLRSALPLIERTGVATLADVDPETLQERIGDSLRAAVFGFPTLVSAWAIKDG